MSVPLRLWRCIFGHLATNDTMTFSDWFKVLPSDSVPSSKTVGYRVWKITTSLGIADCWFISFFCVALQHNEHLTRPKKYILNHYYRHWLIDQVIFANIKCVSSHYITILYYILHVHKYMNEIEPNRIAILIIKI